jgi:hypothetical protein
MLVYNYGLCYVATRYSSKGFWIGYLLMAVMGFIPTWSLAAYLSKNLIFDALLYDTLLVISSVVFFTWMGKAESFVWLNWIGLGLVVMGLILTRWTFKW